MALSCSWGCSINCITRCITNCITDDSQNGGWARNETGTGFDGKREGKEGEK